MGSHALCGLGAFHAIVYVGASGGTQRAAVSNATEVVQLASIASVVSFPELVTSADMTPSPTFDSSPVVLADAR